MPADFIKEEHMRVLIVEDDAELAGLVRDGLAKMQIEVTVAPTFSDGLERSGQTAFDVVILDVMLPGVDGFAVADGMRRAGNFTPVLMLTAKSLPEDVVHGLEAGADDYLAKPFDFREVRARLGALIRHARRERDRDPVTELPGSRALEEHLAAALAQGASFALLFLEMDGFADVFARGGFLASRKLAQRAGSLVLDRSRGLGFAAHLGAADFAVVAGADDARELAGEIPRAWGPEGVLEEDGVATRLFATVVAGEGCRSVDELCTRLARTRGAARA